MQPEAKLPVSERAIIFLIGSVQFVSVLEFMIVMPLGPDFARALDIPQSHLGYVGGTYTAAAAVSGLVASTFLERFDRRKALAVAMAGLIVSTIGAGLAVNLATLLAVRVMAGLFGGPAFALAMAMVADTIPPERRGKAMGAVMSAFAIASIVGVPAALELARHGGWRAPFFAVALLGVAVVGFALWKLPPMTKHLASRAAAAPADLSYRAMLSRPAVRTAYLLTATVMMGNFMLIPNIAAYVQFNLGYPREQLGMLYFVGGICTFFSMRVVGRLTDKFGALKIGTFGTVLVIAVIYLGFINYNPALPVVAIFALFMVSSSARGVPFQTLASKVPRPAERARFMSLQSSIQHVSTSIGAFLASQILSEGPNDALVGVDTVSWIAIAITATMPVLLWKVERALKPGAVSVAPAH